MGKDNTGSTKSSSKLTYKTGAIIVDAALIILGLLMTIFHKEAGFIICIALGIIMCAFGVLRFISYFAKSKEEAVGSFAIVQSTALLGFGILFIIATDPIRTLLNILLGIILIISGVLKLQYAVDLIRLKAKLWWISFLGAVLTIALGIIIFIFYGAAWLMLFTGISFMVNGVVDLAIVLILDKEKKANKASTQGVQVDSTVVSETQE